MNAGVSGGLDWGSAIAGVYPYEIAEHKGLEATQLSRANGFPLRIQVEQE